jgi:O-acetyl-ADP-ribose deacetylase (regulator of RNase III)
MEIKNIDGDLLDEKLHEQYNIGAIAHCCNCRCVMGAGIARQISKKYPDAYAADFATYALKDDKLGLFSNVETSDSLFVYNLYGQSDYKFHGRAIDYEAFYTAFESALLDFSAKGLDKALGVPKNIGCGLAGGDWEIVKTIMVQLCSRYAISLVIVNYNQ